MKTIHEQKLESVCYGKGYEPSEKECKICELASECQKLTLVCETKKPESPLKKARELSANKAKENPEVAIKVKATANKNELTGLPDFKVMTFEELEKLAIERKAKDNWKKFDNPGIRRMRLTMALKETYKNK